MSTLYLIALCGFCAVMFAVMFEAVARVSRKPVWHAHQPVYAAREAAAPFLVSQPPADAPAAPLVHAIAVLAVEERHSGFAGLTNAEEFELTA